MQLFVVLVTLAVVAAVPQKKFVLDSLGKEAGKILVCTSKGSTEKCDSCCETTNWGTDIDIITNAEKTSCHTSCKILPNDADYITTTIIPGGPFKRDEQEKRFVLDSLTDSLTGIIGDSAIVAMCAAKLNEQDCQYCCQSSQFQVADAAEKALCTTGCQVLPSKSGVEKRFFMKETLSDAKIIAQCELKPTKAECETCCNGADWGLLGAAEIPLCVKGCDALHKDSKRWLLEDLSIDNAAKDLSIVAQCETKATKADCESCCNNADWGLLGALEKPGCVAGCGLTHKSQSKRILLDNLGDAAADAAIIAQCELKSTKADCEACCNAADFGFLAAIETPACAAGCSLTHKDAKRGLFDTIQQETQKVLKCEMMGVEEKCHSCCETTNWGVSTLADTEKNLCINGCYLLPGQASVDKMPATASPAETTGF